MSEQSHPLPPGTPVIVTDAAIGPDSWWSPRACYIMLDTGYWLYPDRDVFPAADYAVVPKALLREVDAARRNLRAALSRAGRTTIVDYPDTLDALDDAIDALRPFAGEGGDDAE